MLKVFIHLFCYAIACNYHNDMQYLVYVKYYLKITHKKYLVEKNQYFLQVYASYICEVSFSR